MEHLPLVSVGSWGDNPSGWTHTALWTQSVHTEADTRAHTHALLPRGSYGTLRTCVHTPAPLGGRACLAVGATGLRTPPSRSEFRVSLQTPAAAPGSPDQAPLPRGPQSHLTCLVCKAGLSSGTSQSVFTMQFGPDGSPARLLQPSPEGPVKPPSAVQTRQTSGRVCGFFPSHLGPNLV